jgi:hypothetical protein
MSRRCLAKVVTLPKLPMTSQPSCSKNISFIHWQDVTHGACELDLHVDTCVTGPNCTVIEHTNQIVSVSGFSHEYEAIHDVPIVTAATAFDDPVTGNITILIIGQALYLSDKVSCTLLSPNQLRSNGIVVDYVPVHLAPRSHPSKHASYSNDEENSQLLLQLRGCISYFESRTLTQEELESCH